MGHHDANNPGSNLGSIAIGCLRFLNQIYVIEVSYLFLTNIYIMEAMIKVDSIFFLIEYILWKHIVILIIFY